MWVKAPPDGQQRELGFYHLNHRRKRLFIHSLGSLLNVACFRVRREMRIIGKLEVVCGRRLKRGTKTCETLKAHLSPPRLSELAERDPRRRLRLEDEGARGLDVLCG